MFVESKVYGIFAKDQKLVFAEKTSSGGFNFFDDNDLNNFFFRSKIKIWRLNLNLNAKKTEKFWRERKSNRLFFAEKFLNDDFFQLTAETFS